MLKPLTSFRFFAALLVFAWHCSYIHPRLGQYLLGYIGVSFFFALSGFILTYTYLPRYANREPHATYTFYLARVARIYPVYFLTFLLAIPATLLEAKLAGPVVPLHFIKMGIVNIVALQSFVPNNVINFSFNGPAWSLSDELFFYALFPLVALLLLKYFRKLRPPVLIGAMLAIYAVSVAIISRHVAVIDDWAYYVSPATRFIDFLQGCLLAALFMKNVHMRVGVVWATVFEVVALAGVVAAILFSPDVPLVMRFSLLLMPCWAALIYVFAFQEGLLSRVLSWRPFVFLGEISFSFYMTHLLVIRYLNLLHVGLLKQVFIAFAVTLLISTALYRWYETPMRKLIVSTSMRHGKKLIGKKWFRSKVLPVS